MICYYIVPYSANIIWITVYIQKLNILQSPQFFLAVCKHLFITKIYET